jgi:translation initiation factor 2 alpha subunit (eIF-2alpha)
LIFSILLAPRAPLTLEQAVSEEVAAIAEKSNKKQHVIENEQREKRKIIDDVNSWISSLLSVTYRFVEYRFFAKNFPEVDDLVTVEVKKVEDLGAYVTLLEFGEIEGMVPLSELSRRRIRSVGKLVRVGRVEIVSVIRVDDKAGYIDLSKKRVSSEEKTQQNEKYEKAKSVHSIIYSVGAHTGVPVETLYENIGWPLYKKYGHGFEGMRQILADGNVLGNYGITEEVKFEVIAKANALLHSKGLKQLPMHDNAPLPKSDFEDLVKQTRSQVLDKSENAFRPLYTMLTGQTIQDSAVKEETVSPKASAPGSEVSAFFALNAEGNAYYYRSADHISTKVREVLRRNIEHKLKLNPVKVRADFDATCFGERGVEAIKDAFMEVKNIDDFCGQLPEPGSEKEPSCFLFLQGFVAQGSSEAQGVQALRIKFADCASDVVVIRCNQTPKNGTVGLVEFKTVEAATKALESERARLEKAGQPQTESVVFYQLMRPRITLIAPPMYIMETTTLDQQRGINLLLRAIEVVAAKLASEDGNLKVSAV